jgi:hypothetical protein
MQTKRNLTIATILVAFILQSCIYEFLPKEGKYEKFLVVYGMITTENGPHEITIYQNRQIGEISFDFVGHAIVSLSDDVGNIIPLTEASNGRYLTPGAFAGQIGTKYKLNILLQNGKQYESDYVELLDVPGISEIKAEHIIKPTTATTKQDEGYQFYISTEPGNSNQKYFRWEIVEDWETDMPYIYEFYWDGKSLTEVNIPNKCYEQRHLEDIYISTTNISQSNCLTNYPLNFTGKYYKLQYGYGIRVRQYSLSEFSYKFWENAIENNNPNALNSKQQYPLVGNIRCISNPKELVYGILEASAVKIKNLQVNKMDVMPKPLDCGIIKTVQAVGVGGSFPNEPPAMVVTSVPPQLGAVYFLVRENRCIYCEATGKSTIRPEYWGNK